MSFSREREGGEGRFKCIDAESKTEGGSIGGHHIFKYVEGTTYRYNLDGSIDITLSSAEGQQSSTKIKATVLLTQLPQCNQLLRLQNVQVVGPDAKKYGGLSDIDKPIRINFHDGHVEDSICTLPKDNQHSINIKRAIASMFQAAIKQNYETDVFGVCPTEIKTRQEGHNYVVQKSRNLNKCAHRESISQDFMATAFNLDSDIKATPLLKGQYNSEQRIKNGILDYASVSESYLHVPFSIGQNGAKATAMTKIQLIGSSMETPKDQTNTPRSIIFENPHVIATEQNNVDAILNALKDTKNTIDLTVDESSAKAFMNLFKILRASKKDDILTVFRQVKAGAGFKDKDGTKNIFLDAVFRAGTGQCVEVAIELLKSKELDPIEQKLVYLSLAFVKHATLESLQAAMALLDQPDLPREAYLGVGTLVRRYCRHHSCENVDTVNALVQKLVGKLGTGKPKSRKEENEIISALKALANMGVLTDPAMAKVVAIAQDKKSPSRLRVVALETYLANACKDKIRDSSIGILKDIQQDSEFRIKAYLVVAKCPTGKTANVIKSLLDNEQSYQVGGFILSHLKNLKASVNPDKEHAKHVLGQINTNKRFPFDFRKYSFNNEYSGSLNSYGASGVIESNVIYSQDSFLPVSTDINVTAEVFGATYNFLELSLRQENLGHLLEHYFGPLGVLNTASTEDLVNTGRSSIEKLTKHFQQRLSKTRGKRDVSKAEIDSIGKQVQIKTHELNKDLDIDFCVKMFGSERAFLSINDQTQNFSPDTVIDQIFDALDDGINKIKNLEKSIQSNFIFLDAEFSYPTSLGFPLKVSAEGSSSVQLKIASKVDIRALLNNNLGSSPLKVSLIPSANIEISGSLTVDAQVVEGGLKYASNLHSATGAELEVIMTHGGNGVDVKFSLPVQEQKLISAKHDIVFNTRELGKSEHNQAIKLGQNKDFAVCIDQLSPLIGLAFCVDINSPPTQSIHGVILPYPLSGNAKFSVSIQREDLSQIHYNSVVYKENDKLGAEYLLETIGEKSNKKVSLQIQAYLTPEAFVKAVLISPVMPLTVEGRITNNNHEKSITLKVDQGNQQYLAKLGFSVSGNAQKSVYKPIIDYNGPGIKGQKIPLSVEGTINVEQIPNGVKYVFDNLKIIGSNQKSVGITGNVGFESRTFFSDVAVSDGRDSGFLKGKLSFEKDKVNLNGELKNTFNPNANFKIEYTFKHTPDLIESDLEVTHGQDLFSKVNKIKTANMFSFKKRGTKDYEVTAKNKFEYPVINFNSKLDFEVAPKKVKYEVEFHYSDIKIGSDLDFVVSQKAKADYKLKFKLYGFDNKVELKSEREVTGEKSKISNILDLNGNKFEVDGTIMHHVKPDDINVGANLIIRIPGSTGTFNIVQKFVLKPSQFDTSLKISAGVNAYIDFFIKSNRMGNANGDLKVTFKDFVVGNGHLQVTKGTGTAFIVIDLVKFHRKLKIDSSFTVHDPKYDLILTIYPNYEMGEINKLVLSTQNQIKENSIDSHNFLEISGKKLEVNFKGSGDDQQQSTKQNAEVEVILPTNHYFSAKLQQDRQFNKNTESGHFSVFLEKRDDKSGPGAKLEFKGELKDGNREKGVYDLSYVMIAENEKGKNIKTEVTVKRSFQNEQYNMVGSLKVLGSALSDVLEVNSNIIHSNVVGTYKIETKYGQKNTLIIDGKYDLADSDKKISGDFKLDIKTASSLVHVVKFGCSGSVKQPDTPEGETILVGNIVFFVDDSASKPGALLDAKLSTEVNIRNNDGVLKGRVELQKLDPLEFLLKYDFTDKKVNGHLAVDYEKNKFIKSDLMVETPNDHEYYVDFKFDTPQAPGTRLEIKNKKSPDGKILDNEIMLTTNGKKFILTNELVLSDISPAVNVKLVYPDGKSDYFSAKWNKFSAEHVGGALKIGVSNKDFVLESDWDANLESIENFVVKLNVHSLALKLDSVHVEALNKPAKGGKRIYATVTSAGKNWISGSTTYKVKEAGDKYVVEGSGAFKVQETNKQTNFKFVRQLLSAAKNGEEGAEVSFNAAIGSQAIDAEYKATDKQFRIMNSYCEEKQQCAHIEIDSKTNVASAEEYNNELEVALDLRKLGLSHEFGLKGVTTRKGFVLDHNVDIYFQEKANKYQYSVYVHPNEIGAQLSTPKRMMALEGYLKMPNTKNAKDKGNTAVRGELAFYLDKKNQPQQKTALVGALNCRHTQQEEDCNGEIKLTNPALGKDLTIKFTRKYDLAKLHFQQDLIVDVFASPHQQIVVSVEADSKKISETGFSLNGVYEIKSQGMGIEIKYEESLYFDYEKYEAKYIEMVTTNIHNQKRSTGMRFIGDRHHTEMEFKICEKDIITYKCKHNINDDSIIMDSDWNIIGVPTLAAHTELRSPATLKYTIGAKNVPNEKLSIYAAYVPNQIAEVRTEYLRGESKINLMRYHVKLDERNFLKSDSGLESEHIKNYLIVPIKTHFPNFVKEVQKISQSVGKDCSLEVENVSEILKNHSPNLKPLKEYYSNELEKLHSEILSDKTLKEVEEFLKAMIVAFASSTQDAFNRTNEIIENVATIMQEQFTKIVEILNKELVPKFTEIIQIVVQFGTSILEQIVDLAITYVAKIALFLEDHRDEIKRFADTCAAIAQDLGRALYKIGKHAQIVISKEWSDFAEGVSKLPITEELKIRYQQLMGGVEVPTALINTLKEAFITLKDAMPSSDLKKLVGAIGDYIERKLKNEKIDDIDVLQHIVNLLIEVIDKAINSVDTKGIHPYDNAGSFLSADMFSDWSKFGTVKLSSINYWKAEKFPSLSDLIYVISLNPMHWIPPYQLDAVVVQGQHIFTFDGKHMTFPGDCKYLLSRDAVNGNFTIVGTLTKGLLTALTFSDKTHLVTLKKGGLLLNNAATEFPIRFPGLDVFRINEVIQLKSKTGVTIICDDELLVCTVTVSGYYHSQLRGLLGNGNTEPFDDYTLPSGKIVTSESEFGNSYKIGNCAPVKTVDHGVHHHKPECVALFGEDSSLRYCHPFVNPENYKTACDHGLASNVQDTEKAIIIGYVTQCYSKLIPVHLPYTYMKCKNAKQQFGVGETFSVKSPDKAADIVVVVDLVKSNEVIYKEWLQPALTQVTNELNARGINDVEMHMITYGGTYQSWPSHQTVAGKLTFKGKTPNLKFSEEPKEKPFATGSEQTDHFLEMLRQTKKQLELVSGQSLLEKAHSEAVRSPFRSHAAKSIILVSGKPCDQGIASGLQKLRSLFLSDKDISLNLITPFHSFNAGDPKYSKNVIGFNAHNIFAISDPKKRLEGTADHYDYLDYDDYCVDFTLKHRGNVFVVNNFLQMKGPARKQFVQIAAYNIAEQMTNIEYGLNCECKMTSPFTAQNLCKIAYSKEKPPTTPLILVSGNRILLYQQNFTYVYKYNGYLNISLPNAVDQNSNTEISATVYITPHNECNYELQIKNLKILASNAKTYTNIDGIEKPVGFGYQNGAIGNNVCTEENDPPTSVNVKRAIISLLQLDTKYESQTDIFGICPTLTDVEEHSNGETVVKKLRNLNRCEKRETFKQSFVGESLKNKKILETVPILDSRYMSVQSIYDGILRQVIVYENYTYIAVGQHKNGIKVFSETTLQYIGTHKQSLPKFNPVNSKSIMFDGRSTISREHTRNAILNSLRAISGDRMTVSFDNTRKFSSLIKIMRDSNKKDLISVYDYLKNDNYLKKIFVDAILRCGTNAAFIAGHELALAKELKDNEETILNTGISNIHNPSIEVLRIVADLLDRDKLSRHGYLNVAIAVRNYCEQNSCKNFVVSDIATSLSKKLNITDRYRKDAIFALKALSNFAYLPDHVTKEVLEIVRDLQQPSHLRSTALDALRSAACKDNVRLSLFDTLENTEEDSEIRIKAYLALARCPNLDVVRFIENVINNEPSYQVGSFITSHVLRQNNILSTIKIGKTFPTDPTKYSFSTEILYNLGGIEMKSNADVLYSQKSFLPKYVNINVSADVLGSYVNFLEFEIRQDNLEKMLERYYGPMGLKRNKKFGGRYRRDVSHSDDEWSLDLGVKLFGSNTFFMSTNDNAISINHLLGSFLGNVESDVKRKLYLREEKQNNIIFVESQMSYPTSLGFPMRLGIEGVSSFQLKTEMDPKKMEQKFVFIPSANIDITTSIGVDLNVVESGVQIVSSVYATAGILIDFSNYNVETKLSLPLERQQLAFSHNIYLHVRETGNSHIAKLVNFPNQQETSYLIMDLTNYTGLSLHAKLNAPPHFENVYLAGNYKAELMLNNTDFSHLSIKMGLFNDSQFFVKIVGPKQKTKLGIVMEASGKNGYACEVTVILPTHNISAEANYTWTNTEKSVYAKLKSGSKQLFGKIGVRSEQMMTYIPIVQLTIPGHNIINTKGRIIASSIGQDFHVKLDNLQFIFQFNRISTVYTVRGYVEKQGQNYRTDSSLSYGQIVRRILGKLYYFENKYKFNGHLTNNDIPHLNVHVEYDLIMEPEIMQSKLLVVHGKNPKSKTNCLNVTNIFIFANNDIESFNKIIYPAENFSVQVFFKVAETIRLYELVVERGFSVYRGRFDLIPNTYLTETTLNLYVPHNINWNLQNNYSGLANNKNFYEVSVRIQKYAITSVLKSPYLETIFLNGTLLHNGFDFIIKDSLNTYGNCSVILKDNTNINLKFLTFIPHVFNIDTELFLVKKVLNAKIEVDIGKYYITKAILSFIANEGSLTWYPDLLEEPTLYYKINTNTNIDMWPMFESRNSFEISGDSLFQLNLGRSLQIIDDIILEQYITEFVKNTGCKGTIIFKTSSNPYNLQDSLEFYSYDGNLSVLYVDDLINVVANTDYLITSLENETNFKINVNVKNNNSPYFTWHIEGIEASKKLSLASDMDIPYAAMSIKNRIDSLTDLLAYNAFFDIVVDGAMYRLRTQIDTHSSTPMLNLELTYPDGKIDQILFKCNFAKTMMSHSKINLRELLETTLILNAKSKIEFDLGYSLNFPMLQVQNFIFNASCKPKSVIQSRGRAEIMIIKYSARNFGHDLMIGSTNFSMIRYNHDVNYNITTKIIVKTRSKMNNFNSYYLNPYKPEVAVYGGHKIDIDFVYLLNRNLLSITYNVVLNDSTRYISKFIVDEKSFACSLKTPHRLVLLEGEQKIYHSRSKIAWINFYPNKIRNPLQKSSLVVLDDCIYTPDDEKCYFELKFVDPKLPKAFLVGYYMEVDHLGTNIVQSIHLDVFNRKKDEIRVSAKMKRDLLYYSQITEIYSEGLNFMCRYENSFVDKQRGFEYTYRADLRFGNSSYNNSLMSRISGREILFNLSLCNTNVLKINSRSSSNHKALFINTTIDAIGLRPMHMSLKTNNLNSANFTVALRDETNEQYDFYAKVFGGDIFRLKATSREGTLAATLLTVKRNKFLFDFMYNSVLVKTAVLRKLIELRQTSTEQLKSLLTNADLRLNAEGQKLNLMLDDAVLDFKEFLLYYKQQKSQIKKELRADSILHNVELLQNAVLDLLYDLMEIGATFTRTIAKSYGNSYTNIKNNLQKANSILSVRPDDILVRWLFDLNQYIGKNEERIRISGMQVFEKLEGVIAIAETIKVSARQLYIYVKDTIIFNKLKDTINRVPPASEEFIQNFRRLTLELKHGTNLKELNKLIDVVSGYMEKKMRREHVDDDVEIEYIWEAFEDTLKAIVDDDDGTLSWTAIATLHKMLLLVIKSGPYIANYSWITVNEVSEMVKAELDRFKLPSDFNGVVGKHHIFTFDGKHVTLQNNCTFLLVEDILDSNFSISASYRNGLESITFKDKQYTVKLNKDGKVKIYNSYSSLPLYLHNLHIQKNSYSVNLKSKYGAQLLCDLKLTACSIKISGYYHGRLKGLLGYANREKFDDFLLPTGKITDDSETFLNLYQHRICKNTRIPSNSHNNSVCSRLFDTNYLRCFDHVDHNEYEVACNEAMEIGLPDVQSFISLAYIANCNAHGIYVSPVYTNN
ncbi:hypothetical protein FQA39_LY17393 [Lamprigera yunnana]|nr:hypothetical protein FQA39_LY17393 [Lamprigera yunnana]